MNHRPDAPNQVSTRTPRWVAACLVAWLAGQPFAAADEPLAGTSPPLPRAQQVEGIPSTTSKVNARQRAAALALEAGLDYLAQLQGNSVDGSFPLTGASKNLHAPVAVSALCTLALLAGGSTPERGPHGRQVARGIDYLYARVQLQTAAPNRGYVGSGADQTSKMHGHGYATLALAQAFAISPQTPRGARLARALPLATALIERTQGAEGGWYYEPQVEVQHEGSVTICLVQALRAARNAGVSVDGEVIARAESYVRRSQAENGEFRYQIGSDQTSVALTAAAISTLNAAGRYQDQAIQRGIDAIWRSLTERESSGELPQHPFYERFYLAQALWQNPSRTHFDRWYEDELRQVLASQNEDGSWDGSGYGLAYATAYQCLFLAIPLETLPILTR